MFCCSVLSHQPRHTYLLFVAEDEKAERKRRKKEKKLKAAEGVEEADHSMAADITGESLRCLMVNG